MISPSRVERVHPMQVERSCLRRPDLPLSSANAGSTGWQAMAGAYKNKKGRCLQGGARGFSVIS